MNTYTTQMDAARKGIVTPQIKTVAEKEHMPVEKLMQLVAEGKVAICANKHHKSLNPEGVGSMLRTKINVNLGVSRDCKDYDIEMQKVMSAVNMGAEAIMDLSSHGDTQPFRRKLTSECPAMIGTVPVYDSVIHYQRDLATLTAQDFIDVVRMHAEDGVDFVTLHCGITRKTIDQIKKHKRKMNIVSRGGSLVFAWMTMTGEENPFYEYYDEILEICEEHDVTISLGVDMPDEGAVVCHLHGCEGIAHRDAPVAFRHAVFEHAHGHAAAVEVRCPVGALMLHGEMGVAASGQYDDHAAGRRLAVGQEDGQRGGAVGFAIAYRGGAPSGGREGGRQGLWSAFGYKWT